MKGINKILLLSATLFTSIGVTSAAINLNSARMSAVSAKVTTVSDAEIASYYSSINDSMSGTTLLTALNSLNTSKKKRNVGYDGYRQFAAKCDIDPNGSKIVGFYDNKLLGPSWDSGKTWNREHVWPKSRKGSYVENDAHMVRGASTKTNGDRGNKFFATGVYDPGSFVANYRGISARIIFYCAIADKSLKLVDSNDDSTSSGTMGKLSDLLKWNLEYQPSKAANAPLELRVEQNRNNVIYKDSDGQGNRNPFIDHPEYACKIWGNTNETTKAICKNNIGGGGSGGQGGGQGGGGITEIGETTNGGCAGSIVKKKRIS